MKLQLFIWANFLSVFVVCIYPEFDLKIGTVRGKYYLTTVKKRTFSAFIGIPYAKPPIGRLRFQAPEIAEIWDGILDATRIKPVCPQKIADSIVGNEDCLHLNIYTPKLTKDEYMSLPVMVFIHGGAFLGGNSDYSLYGPNLLLSRNIVLVVLNYRLGPFGFLSTGDQVVPGNNGLKDQHCALKWIKNNIEAFGGNPNKIILFGQSAGAVSAHLHMLSPLSKDLLNGVIIQSGAALSPWAIDLNGQVSQNSKQLANHFKCSTQNSEKMLQCLKNVTTWDIIKAVYFTLADINNNDIPFKPVIEPSTNGSFLTEEPKDIIRMGKVPNIPLMVGFNSEDGAFKAAGIFGNPQLLQRLNKDITGLLSFNLDGNFDTESIRDHLKKLYFDNQDVSTNMRSEVVTLFTDSLFLVPALNSVELHTRYTTQPVYYYIFAYRGDHTYRPFYGDRGSDNYGVCLGDELLYLFEDRESFPFITLSEDDQEMANTMTNLWVNFAKHGNPTPTSKVWRPAKSEKLQYYFIRSPKHNNMVKQKFVKRFKFWNNLEVKFRNNVQMYQAWSSAVDRRTFWNLIIVLCILSFSNWKKGLNG